MPRDSDLIMFQHPEYPMDMYGVPTFALGQYPPLLMNRREGDNQYSEEELVRMMGNYAKNLGYVYNPNGLTYGDVNSLMNKSKQFWDDWDGNYQLYLWDDDLKRKPRPRAVFNINDDKSYVVTKRDGRNVVTAKSAETKEASVGMIVRDGDPSSPPSDIFMAAGHTLKRVDRILDTLQDLRNLLDELVEVPESSSGQIFDSISEEDNFYNRTARTQQLLSEAMNQMSMLATEEFNAEDPTQAEASDLGGPTAPGNAGVPADVGGDDLVPYDSPSAPPAGVFMNAEYKTYESRPVRNALFGVAFAVSGLYFWSTAGSVVKNWVVVRVEKYAPKLLEPQFQTMLTLTAFFGIIYFGMKLRGSSKGLTIPSMMDLSEASLDA